MLLRTFGVSFVVTILGLAAAFWYGGLTALAIAAILIILEVSLSFDNAVVNARVLSRMSHLWRRLFLTIGILIAVVGMRLLFPLVVVGLTAHLSPLRAWSLAMEKGDAETPGTYGYILNEAQPSIAAFGGIFLLMIFLDFLMEDKEHYWITHVEKALAKLGILSSSSTIIALGTIIVFATVYEDHTEDVLLYGVSGMLVYLIVHGLGTVFSKTTETQLGQLDEGDPSGNGELALVTGKAAFFMFLYLEMLDASFSFDGVIGAFAITSDPIVIALGLGVGAMYVRSLTIYLVNKGTLSDYVYLEHGAHWAIGALAVLLLCSIGFHVPEVVTGLIGVAFISASFIASLRHNKQAGDQAVSIN